MYCVCTTNAQFSTSLWLIEILHIFLIKFENEKRLYGSFHSFFISNADSEEQELCLQHVDISVAYNWIEICKICIKIDSHKNAFKRVFVRIWRFKFSYNQLKIRCSKK